MALDTSIFAQYLKPVKSIADYDAEYQTGQRNALLLDQARTAQASAAQKMQMDREAAMRGDAERNALAQALQGADPSTLDGQNALVRAAPSLAPTMLKGYGDARQSFAAADKSAADAVKTRGEALDKALSRNRDLLNFVQTPQQAAYWAAAAYQDPDLAPIMQRIAPDPESFARGIPQDPKSFADWRVAGVSSVDKLRDLVRQEMAQAETARHNKAGEANTIRGQNMVDARAREGTQLQRERLNFDKSGGVSAVNAGAANAKPLPPGALKMQQESLDAIGVSSTINADLKALEGQIDRGALKFGPLSNLKNAGLNMAGVSTEESRNFATFKSNMERLRNESLRLNTGVQTDGDAQRAWNELFQNINDTDLVKQRLQEIQRINARGVQLQKLKIDGIRANYGKEPMDVAPVANQPTALDGGVPKFDADKERRYQEWKAKQGK